MAQLQEGVDAKGAEAEEKGDKAVDDSCDTWPSSSARANANIRSCLSLQALPLPDELLLKSNLSVNSMIQYSLIPSIVVFPLDMGKFMTF